MTLQALPGFSLDLSPSRLISLAPSFSSALLIDASTEKAAFVGRFSNKDRAAKSIRKVGFRFGAVTKGGSTDIQVSLQDVSLSAGVPYQPDGTADQTVLVGNANITANTWVNTGNLSADRSISFGDWLAVVFEYSTFVASDSIVISGLGQTGADQEIGSVLNTGSWAAVTVVPNLVLECSDGSFATLAGASPCSAVNTHSYKQDTGSADEYALPFSVPFPCKVDGFSVPIAFAANTSDLDIVLYDGTTAMTGGTVTKDAHTARTTGANHLKGTFADAIQLTAGTTYRLAFKPTQTTSTISVYSIDVQQAGHLDCWPGGQNFNYTTRLDLGSWAGATTTRRLLAGLRFSHFDDAAGGSGGRRPILRTIGT
jgi:hypothetical protein